MSLEAILRPRSVAVIGASERRGTIGHAVFHNLISNGFQGPVYPVKPGARSVQGVHAFPAITDIPDEVDLAVILVRQELVLKVAKGCAAKGVRGIVIITAGFKEIGGKGITAEKELVALCEEHGIRLVGPNCLGAISTHPKVQLNATFAPTRPRRGNVALASQSGALGVAMLDATAELNIGVSDFVSLGNKADVSGSDLLEWWEEDPLTSVILLYLEGFGRPDRFAPIARRTSRKKPIVIVKSGRSERGLLAASSHTGSLAGGDRAVQALVEQCGIIRVQTVEELFDMGAFLANQPLPKGPRVAILTNAGGPAIMATDACEAVGLHVPELSAELQKKLRALLPPQASTHNPVDMIASASPEQYEECGKLLLNSGEIDALLPLFVPPIITDPAAVGSAIARASEGCNCPVIACFMGRHGVAEATGTLEAARIPSFSFPETAAKVLARALRYGRWRKRPEDLPPRLQKINLKAVGTLIEGERQSEERWMSEEGVSKVLKALGIVTPVSQLASSAGEAAGIARHQGFPVVLKLQAKEVSHKSDLGGVKVDLRNEADVFEAYEAIAASAAKHKVHMTGVLVQGMVNGGVETIVGLTRDPTVGPLLMFGLGGVTVELLQDVAFRIPPLSPTDVSDLLHGVRGLPLLQGYRGAPLTDMAALRDVIHRISALAVAFPSILELDLNPLTVLPQGKGCVAVDCRIRLAAKS